MANLNPFSKVLQKQAGRAKERLLQNFGKADRTADEDFDLHVKNFSKQQNAVLRLQKEFKNYHQCLKAMQAARRSLMDTVCELYEPCWDGVEEFLIKSDISNRTFEDFCDNLNIQILAPVGSYVCQFPEITNKISKRNRKLLDYDNCRHNLQNLETMKKKEDAKLTKAREQLDDARSNFETINKELHEELPTLYDGRVAFFATHLQCLFLTEFNYHTKDAVVCSEIGELLSKLKKAYEEGAFAEGPVVHFASKDSETEFFLARERLRSHSLSSEPKILESKVQEENPQEIKGKKLPEDLSKYTLRTLYKMPGEYKMPEEYNMQEDKFSIEKFSSESPTGSTAFSTPTTTIERNASLDLEAADDNDMATPKFIEANENTPEKENNHVLPNVEKVKGDVTPNTTATHVLYQVQGTYKYVAEDGDELSFNVGDVIDVVEYDDPEEQEEGWLMGIFDGKKGLFPANFTSRI